MKSSIEDAVKSAVAKVGDVGDGTFWSNWEFCFGVCITAISWNLPVTGENRAIECVFYAEQGLSKPNKKGQGTSASADRKYKQLSDLEVGVAKLTANERIFYLDQSAKKN